MEGVAFALRAQVRALAGDARPSAIHCAGGAARSDVWLQIKADVLNMTTTTTQCQETVGQGAAVLAEAALSGRTVPAVAREWIRSARPHRPDPERHSLYNTLRSA
jgi:xylulokinase